MESFSIREKCHVNTNFESDTFVGIKAEDGDVTINFPLGYNVAEDDKELRRDILLLLETLASNVDSRDSEMLGSARNSDEVQFPIQAYIYVISDYLSRGLYKEQEVLYQVSNRGKISWKRTISTQKAYEQNGNVFYLNYVTKRNSLKENELITQIHEYLVYDSFNKIGWLFTGYIPNKPRIKFNKRLFVSVLVDKLQHTFNDKNKALFNNMLKIINYMGDVDSPSTYRYGTYRFEYVWEKMIDKVFGIATKSDYFPKTTWIVKGVATDNASLEPDTIMLCEDDVYVLDAKYYKYGYTGRVGDLPESTSINKQITYGEYIHKQIIQEETQEVYNAFIMPYNASKRDGDEVISIGEAISSWKRNNKPYQRVVGILYDVKTLMSKHVRQDKSEISRMAKIIRDELANEV